jgi:hypothetical protein
LTRVLRKKARGGVPADAHGDILTAQTSASGTLLARREIELYETRTEFHDEVEAYLEQERQGWLDELV